MQDLRKTWPYERFAFSCYQTACACAKLGKRFSFPCHKLRLKCQLDQLSGLILLPLFVENSRRRHIVEPKVPNCSIPVLSEDYAIKIARDWNVKASGSGYVTRFDVLTRFLDAYDVQEAGGRAHLEYWIPAEELDAFNEAIIGQIEVTREFR